MGRGYPEDWNRRRKEVYRRDNHMCQNCGAKGGPHGTSELHAHHVVPKSKGGTHNKRNLITVCKACHDAIHGSGTAPTALADGDLSTRVQKAIEQHYRTDEYEDGYVRLGKSAENPSPTQQDVDDERNRTYDGCPNCGAHALTVSWIGFQPGSKVKVVECRACSSQYDEQLEKRDGVVQRTLHEIDDPSDLEPSGSAFLKELKDQIRLTFNL